MTRLDEILDILYANDVKRVEVEAIRIAVIAGYWQSTAIPMEIPSHVAATCKNLIEHDDEEDIEPMSKAEADAAVQH